MAKRQPPANPCPLTAATTGMGSVAILAKRTLRDSAIAVGGFPVSLSHCKSFPLEKNLPTEVIINALGPLRRKRKKSLYRESLVNLYTQNKFPKKTNTEQGDARTRQSQEKTIQGQDYHKTEQDKALCSISNKYTSDASST
jgi:hypothetical protein